MSSRFSTVAVSLIIGLVAGSILSSVFYRVFLPDRVVVSKTDTTIVVDTTIYVNPIPVDVEVSISETIVVPPSDITVTQDSLIVLPKSVKTYSDKSYKCQVSGYQPSLDWIEVYPETVTITKETTITQKPRRWGVGIQAGYGAYLSGGQVKTAPYIGVGISYNLIRF